VSKQLRLRSPQKISATADGDQLVFQKLVEPSSNSVFRLYLSDAPTMQAVRDQFRALGVETELSNLPKLVALEVPGDVDFGPVANLLGEGAASGRWEYEEGVLRHAVPV
jgi:hypothetical protein